MNVKLSVFRHHNLRYFISHTKSYNAFKFSTAACNATPLLLKGHLPLVINYYTLSSDANLGCLWKYHKIGIKLAYYIRISVIIIICE